jgi:hypothetical protein
MHRAAPAPDFAIGIDEAIAQALVVAFGVIVLQELANGPAQRCFAEEDEAVETLFLQRGIISLHCAQVFFAALMDSLRAA